MKFKFRVVESLNEGYEDIVKYLATGGKTKLKKRKRGYFSFNPCAGNPAYNADWFNHVMGTDGGKFGAVNGSTQGTLTPGVGNTSGGEAPSGGDTAGSAAGAGGDAGGAGVAGGSAGASA
jgi:hypothetical protein